MGVLKKFEVSLENVEHTRIKLTKRALEKQNINYILKELDELNYSDNELKETSSILCNMAIKLKENSEVVQYLSQNRSYKNVEELQVCINNFFKNVLDNKFVDSASSNDKKRKKDYNQILKGFRLIAEILQDAKLDSIQTVGILEMIANLMSVCESGWKANMVEILTRFEKRASKKCSKDIRVAYEDDKMKALLKQVFFEARVSVAKKLSYDYIKENDIKIAYQPHCVEIFYKYLNMVYNLNLPITKVNDNLYPLDEKVRIALDFQYTILSNRVRINDLIFNKAVFLFREKVSELKFQSKEEDGIFYKNFYEMLTEWGSDYIKDNKLENEVEDVTEFLTDYVMDEDITKIRNVAIKEIMKYYGFIKEKKVKKIKGSVFRDRVNMVLEDIKTDKEKENLERYLLNENANLEDVLSVALEMNKYDILNYIEGKSICNSSKKKIENIKYNEWFKCVNKGSINSLRKLIELRIDVDKKDKSGNTALYIACSNGKLDVVKLLLNNNAKVNQICRFKRTALYTACINGHDDIVNLLVEKDGKIFLGGINTDRLIYRVVERKYREVLKKLVEQKVYLDMQYKNRETVLHKACSTLDLETAKILVDGGANVNIQDEDFNIPLHIACKTNNLEMVKLLTRAGSFINSKGFEEKTPLYIACEMGNIDIVKYLVACGIELDIKNINGATPLNVAVYKGHKDIVKFLIANGANIKGKAGELMLWRALVNKDYNIADILIKNGVKATGKANGILFHSACNKKDIDTVEFLIKAGVDVNFKDELKNTALYNAVVNENTELIKVLLKAKCNLTIKCGKKNKTALDIAKEKNLPQIQRLLDANLKMSAPINKVQENKKNHGKKLCEFKFLVKKRTK